ncbi:DUF2652 domain-containing protein [Muricauda sp. JGD-17]|uniref:DUF2652 domain-containing protein n=1 Tax=Flagellimonas ochracea TaxID=2696472 RepID=A0A964T9X0_9FLAO|nr:DUF2652 domain-containing protein [Allomuricauda ochracea]NAY90945.1 DUF2652 domain-containing protein [Allomuricauda ochracea]
MAKSLLFIPDISGYTKFIQTTEVEHSQHVISELLEVLLNANTQGLKLAEIEGDALFFYKENEIPSQENLLAQIESMFTAFHSHLKMLGKNRICPCNACATAPNLQLKIIAHSGDIQHIQVQGKRKPFGNQVIEAHRLLKNSVDSENYALITRSLSLDLQLSPYYSSKIFRFRQGEDNYDDRKVDYIYAIINPDELNLKSYPEPKKVGFDHPPQMKFEKHFPIGPEDLMEYITNYSLRKYWQKGVDRLEYNANEVTRIGSEHVCVINGKYLNFTTVTKDMKIGNLIYGERTTSPPVVDELYQFYIFEPSANHTCKLNIEIYWKIKSPIKRILMNLIGKRSFKKNVEIALEGLYQLVEKQHSN